MKKNLFYCLTVMVMALFSLQLNAQTGDLIYWSAVESRAAGPYTSTTNPDFKLTLDNTRGKLVIDKNEATFEKGHVFFYRLKTGGRSQTGNGMTISIPTAGTLKVYARTGSSRATDRNIVLTQNGNEIANHILLESEAKDNVFPAVSAAVVAGKVAVTYPVNAINIYGIGFIAAETTTISDAGYATFASSQDADYSKTEGLKAFRVKYDATSTKVTLYPVTAVPGETPVVLKGAPGTYTINAPGGTPSAVDNDLKLSDGTVIGDGSTIWVLANKSNGVGFYPVASGVAVKKGKAYLILPAFASVKGFIGLNDESVNAIKGVIADNAAINAKTTVYNIAGQKATKAYKGIVIVNGKKYIQK